MWYVYTGKPIETENRLVVAQGQGLIAKGYGVSFGGDENVPKIDCSNDCTYL